MDKESYSIPLRWNATLRDECSLFRFIKNGSFKTLIALNLSNNEFDSLDNMYLEYLPKLHTLDLRNNKFESSHFITRALKNCHHLRSIFLQCAKGPFAKIHDYCTDIFETLRGVEMVDEVKKPKEYNINEREKKAIDFLRIVGGVGINGITTCDLSHQHLKSELFPYILAALHFLKRLCPTVIMNVSFHFCILLHYLILSLLTFIYIVQYSTTLGKIREWALVEIIIGDL